MLERLLHFCYLKPHTKNLMKLVLMVSIVIWSKKAMITLMEDGTTWRDILYKKCNAEVTIHKLITLSTSYLLKIFHIGVVGNPLTSTVYSRNCTAGEWSELLCSTVRDYCTRWCYVRRMINRVPHTLPQCTTLLHHVKWEHSILVNRFTTLRTYVQWGVRPQRDWYTIQHRTRTLT
jgi:hypothetical protein